MTEKRRKVLYWIFKLSAIMVSCALPILAICERFPIWKEAYSKPRSIGVGGVLILIVILLIFRKTVFSFVRDKLKIKYAPPIVTPIIMLIVSYVLLFLADFMRDLNTVSWMYFLGCAIGMILNYIGDRIRGEDRKDE